MPELVANKPDIEALPSVDEIKPDEQGGPVARSGFNYQDEIAVSFLIEMLETPFILKVHCETHDDVLLVREDGSGKRLAEFVQVKASALDKLWSEADLCARRGGKVGTSILEISLAKDKCREESHFRLVTLRPVVSSLRMLTFPRGGRGREPEGEPLKALKSTLDNRLPGLKSPKGNGVAYWLENCFWDQRDSEKAVRNDNLVRLMRLSSQDGRPLLLEFAEVPLEELRSRAKVAGDAKWEPDRDKKIITREALHEWWERTTRETVENAASASGGKLRAKMAEAGLPDELVGLAIEMRRDYAASARTSRYMEPEEAERLQTRVKSEVMSLRSRFLAGQIDLDGAGFHALCVERMDAVNAERPEGSEDRSAFLKGCMYDIVDRCLFRFARQAR